MFWSRNFMKITKLKKPKKMTYSKAKKAAWDAFSLFIRTRDSDLKGAGICFTCERAYPVKLLQAGHWIPGRHMSVLFDERNVNAQCYHCNVGLKGNPVVYYDKMLQVYGKAVCDELKRLDKETKKYKVFELIELKIKYDLKLEEISIENSTAQNFDKSMSKMTKRKDVNKLSIKNRIN